MLVPAVEALFILMAIWVAVFAIRWIMSRPADDPALDRLFFITAPVLWLIRQFTRRP